MARYRKIDPRVWGDEAFQSMAPLSRLSWFALLTHPVMTPAGIGVMPAELLDSLICRYGDFCPICQDLCHGEAGHSGQSILAAFQEAGLIFLDEGTSLVAVKNFLVYNCPDSSKSLAGWIESCEELPRSPILGQLRDHLRALHDATLPDWLFRGLLDPIALGRMRNLRNGLWDRLKGIPDALTDANTDGHAHGHTDALTDARSRSRSRSRTQEQDQEGDARGKPAVAGRATVKASKNGTDPEPDGFEAFWTAYPRKVGRRVAATAWAKAKADLARCLATLAWQVKSDRWTEEGGRFIPHPATWINQGRWADEPVKASVASVATQRTSERTPEELDALAAKLTGKKTPA